ncbi:MAG: single-stranded-DNA-specific exonuclease RecJ [Patescibacteria group bacterium]
MKWNIKSKAPSAFLKQFPEYSSLICNLLYNRNIKTQKQIDEFFNPDYLDDIHDPFLLKGMKKAVTRIIKAIEKKEKIFIYGDYDADGVCSSSILFLTLKELGVKNPGIYIPDRDKEGHGLNENSIVSLSEKKANLIITVDCGCTNFKEIDLAKSLGIDVIITDHHSLRDKIPNAFVLIDPFQKGDKYPFKELAGAGVTYKLACALLRSINKEKSVPFEKWLLDITAIATIADMMPLIRENRALVKYGLGVLAQTKWPGLQELMKISGIDPKIIHSSKNGEAPLTNLNTQMIGFGIGPRLNAAGRMDHANAAYDLLITKNKEKAVVLAEQINNNNVKRQSLTDKIVKEIESRLNKKELENSNCKFIFEGDSDWPVGLVGLIAGKIARKYNVPTIIYQEKKDLIQASCRSIAQFDLIKAFSKCLNFFDDFGGHKQACGFRMKIKNLSKVKNIFGKIAEKELKDVNMEQSLDIDAEMQLEDINWKSYDCIQNFAPFGIGNLEPKFLVKKAEIISCRTVGNGDKHLKLELIIFGKNSIMKRINAIAFGMGDKNEALKKENLVDIVFELILNEWNNNRSLEMKIIDLRLSL